MSLAAGYRTNFDALGRAFAAGDVALLECQLNATGEAMPVICAVNRLPDQQVEFVPFAMLFTGNPYETVNPRDPDGGFHSQEEAWSNG